MQRWLDSAPVISSSLRAKGKARALPLQRHDLQRSISDNRGAGIVNASSAQVEENQNATEGNSNMDSSGLGMGIPSSVGKIPAAGPSSSSSPRRNLRPDPRLPPEPNDIYRLMNDERLFVKGHGAAFAPREIIVLCHGMSAGAPLSSRCTLSPMISLGQIAKLTRRTVWVLDVYAYTAVSVVEAALLEGCVGGTEG